MAKRKKRSSSANFALGMIVYALIFSVIGAVVLRFLWSYMDEYEKSRPKNTMEEYISSFDENHIKSVAADFVATLDHNVQSEEQSYAVIAEAMKGDLSYAKLSGESSQVKTVYVISLNGARLGQVELTKEEDPVFGFSPWTVSGEELDFSWLLASKTITVPDSWSVYCNGNELDASYLVDEKTPYAILEDFYDEFDLPYMVTYEVDSYVGDISFELKDEKGNSAELSGEDDETLFTANCSEADKAELYDIVEKFISGYVRFMSDSLGSTFDNYAQLRQYIIWDSKLDQRLLNTISGLNYSSSLRDDIVSITLDDSMDLGDDSYYAAATYIVDTTGQKGVVQTTNRMKFIITRVDGEMKVAAIASY